MKRFVELSYEECVALIGDQQVTSVCGGSGVGYQIEVEAFWDSKPGGLVRVLGSIDDGTLRAAFRPVSDDFLIGPDG